VPKKKRGTDFRGFFVVSGGFVLDARINADVLVLLSEKLVLHLSMVVSSYGGKTRS
jgi:hypothetical protein